jgi:hypothetical protein
MQSGDDLQNVWMMFDHIKDVQGWMTMACHVYDLVYYKVMMIAIFDMQSRDTEVQCVLWKKFNAIVEKKWLGTLVFKGFMADGVQTNWDVIHIVYEIRDLDSFSAKQTVPQTDTGEQVEYSKASYGQDG